MSAPERAPKTSEEKCIYCSASTTCKDHVVNPGAARELPCCGEACYRRAGQFIRWDGRWRSLFYLGLFILVVVNLLLITLMPGGRWQYLPMLGIGLLTALFPLVFARYERYQALGIRRTTAVVRVLAAGIAVFALVLFLAG